MTAAGKRGVTFCVTANPKFLYLAFRMPKAYTDNFFCTM
jgi:hypothetical protein